MRISLMGEAGTLCDALDTAGIKWNRDKRTREPGWMFTNSGDFINVTTAGAGLLRVGQVLAEWVKARCSRDVIVVTQDHAIVHVKGLSAEGVERAFTAVKQIEAMDSGPLADTVIMKPRLYVEDDAE